MTDTIGVGLVGCGTIGEALARAIVDGQGGSAALRAVYDRDQDRARTVARFSQSKVCPSVEAMLDEASVGLVIEAASQSAATECARLALNRGRSLLIMSTGALLIGDTFSELARLARERNVSLAVPSGAIGCLDTLRAVRAGLERVILTSTKRPEALRGAPGFAAWESKKIEKPVLVYEGPAGAAVRQFPANVNVAASVSLAGLGPDRTIARVVADPAAPGNVHELVASGEFGEFTARFVNRPSQANPKTSQLAILSALEALRGVCDGRVRVGS
ncbi:MAG: DUF108 domain-containing protein [SAR202 cluster bacterium]|nr:DUF108 domain-containing protein [SAR202 cluster bacterium]